MRKPLALTLAAFACAASLFTLAKAQGNTKEQALATVSLSNAKQLALATMMYCQDYDETFPPGKTMAAIKAKLFPYHKNMSVYVDPISGKDFVYNPALHRTSLAAIEFPHKAVMFYSPVVHTDGMFTIAFTDGHCHRKKKVPSLKLNSIPATKKTPAKPSKRK